MIMPTGRLLKLRSVGVITMQNDELSNQLPTPSADVSEVAASRVVSPETMHELSAHVKRDANNAKNNAKGYCTNRLERHLPIVPRSSIVDIRSFHFTVTTSEISLAFAQGSIAFERHPANSPVWGNTRRLGFWYNCTDEKPPVSFLRASLPCRHGGNGRRDAPHSRNSRRLGQTPRRQTV